jgi:hypothetical protein
MKKQKAGYVIAGACRRYSVYSHIVWCGNGKWVDLKPGNGKVFESWRQALSKAAKLGLLYQTEILHTSKIRENQIDKT